MFLGFAHDASSLLHELLESDASLADRIAVVDFNPDVKKGLDRRKIRCVYGDIGHLDTLKHAEIEDAHVLVCTIPDMLLKGTTNARLLQQLRNIAPEAKAFVTAQRFEEAKRLYEQGAAFVYLPRIMSVRDLSQIVLSALSDDLEHTKQRAIEQIGSRSEVLP